MASNRQETQMENSCNDCDSVISGKARAIICGFCENMYCFKCCKLKQALFNEIPKEPSLNFTCHHCRSTLPSVKKLLASVASLEERLSKMEKNGAVKCDREVIREIIQEERDEEKEIEMRKLHVIIHSLPESKGTSVEDKKADDKGEVLSILNDVLNLDVQTENIMRLGKNIENREKARPVRFSVENFEGKRKVLDASRRLKNHEKYSSIFLTPDLTPKQRKQAFELREEKRMRERNGESGLMIRKGRIVKQQERQQQHDHPYTSSGARGRSDRREPSSPVGGGRGSVFRE